MHISLNRQFSPVPKNQEDAEREEIRSIWGHVKPKSWDDLELEYRSVILAEAGAGKTEELRHRARVLAAQNKPSFFICIEDIEADFYKAFEVGDEPRFQSWLQSIEDAWFFLDSVDEARLDNPKAFKNAIRCFATVIGNNAHRAHIYISSRPYAWRPIDDRRLVDDILFLPVQRVGTTGKGQEKTSSPSALNVYVMRPLDRERVRCFCNACKANDIDRLLHEIDRANFWSLAERPFDLEGILAKWDEDRVLGGRLDLLRHNIDKRLCDSHNIDRAQRQPLNTEKARHGARRLAAAVILTGMPGLNVPDKTHSKPGIEAETVLADWDPKDVGVLLGRGIFNDIIYGAVRFRHRDVRELLAAEWFAGLLKEGNSRHAIESLFFREEYGEKIVTPRLRPILPWLILLDDEIRRKALGINPEIVVEGGDPSRLPLMERRQILADIVHRIVSGKNENSTQDTSAIARIADPDLSEDTRRLISEYGSNDEAIFFLGRLVWQGDMSSCVAPFIDIAQDAERGIYARKVSALAVMTCGSNEQKQRMWQGLNDSEAQIPRELFAELVEPAEPSGQSIERILTSLSKLTPYERYTVSGLGRALHGFIDRLPVGGDQKEFIQLLDGLNAYLDRQPYIKRGGCHVSDEYAWLISPATHAVERLVEARSTVALGTSSLSILLKVPALRNWSDYDLTEHKSKLQALVPDWPELNDTLYWASIEEARSYRAEKSGEALTDDSPVSWLDHYWSFNTSSLSRLLDFMRSRSLQDDRLVALSTAYSVFARGGRSANILEILQGAVATDSVLRNQLDTLNNPPVSEKMRKGDEEHAEYLRKCEEEKKEKKQARDTWIADLRSNPDRVRNPPNLKPGEWTKDQYWLMSELYNSHSSSDRSECANWEMLIPEFGEEVAHAYRDAAVKFWRNYLPTLLSEGVKRDGTPFVLIFAMAGLEIEAAECPEFPGNLDEAQVRHALRYITWENGFARWFERLHGAFPVLAEGAVIKELVWELENAEAEKSMHYILGDVVYYAPWLHHSLAPALLAWIDANPKWINTNRHYCMQILVNGGVDPEKLALIAHQQMALTSDPDSIAWWHAVRVDCLPANGILDFEQWLSSLDSAKATHCAEIFITTLMGNRHNREGGSYFGHFRTADHLKSLYILMHQYIRVEDDIKRMGGGVYSPELRDKAQDARGRLFSLLSEIPGKKTYVLIKQLIDEHPDPALQPWMAKKAYKRAEEDGDLEPWSAEQVSTFDRSQTIIPATHRQLFDLAVNRLIDLKNWVERGNDSPWKTWQRAHSETEMRNLIAGWFNQQRSDRYVTAQEPELANSQRMDIWLQSPSVKSPVPIELKLLDKSWNGPDLCERLRNQLAGDYLREESAGCGMMLLVSQGRSPKKRWVINGQRVGLSELAGELKLYWQSIADYFPGVEAIEVVVIDLAVRAKCSDL